MAYFVVEDFRFGMDRRRERVAGTPGTLWLGKNVHVTRGADIERRKKFVRAYSVPNTFGAAVVRSQLYVFGSADLAASMPVNVLYQRLTGSAAMSRVLDAKGVNGNLYAIAEYVDGNVFHFYNGVRLTDWDVIAAASASFATVASLLAIKAQGSAAVSAQSFGDTITFTAATPGAPFTIAASATNGGGVNDQVATLTAVQANQAETSEVRASATITITGGSAGVDNYIASVTVNATELLSAQAPWTTSDAITATNLATAITNGFATHGFTASAINAIVTIQAAPGQGAAANGMFVGVTTQGTVTATTSGVLAGGVTAVAAVAQINTVRFSGTFETADTFSVTINGVEFKATGLASATGRTAYVDQKRVWSPVGSLWRYSMLSRPDIWDPANPVSDNDAGFINVASDSEGNEDLVVAARYQTLAAVFSANNIVMYGLDPDPANFAIGNTLENTGTISPQAVVRYGNNDVFYLDQTGIRSLRARDSSNAPFVSDIGNAIDTFVQDYVDSLSLQQVANATAAIEPRDGRYWLVIGGRIFVLSFFPGAKISAWSFYEPTEFGVDEVQSVVRQRKLIFVRAGDYLYAYGGLSGAAYPEDDEVVAEVEMPFLSAKSPATNKQLLGFDFAATNVWSVELAFDPNHPDKTINVGRISKITMAERPSIPVPGETSMVAPKLTCSKGGEATISMFALHYEGDNPT